MASRIGVECSTLFAYENGTRRPSLDVLIRISKLFNVTIDSLMGFDKGDYLDATGLTPEQRNSVDEIIIAYKKLNSLLNYAHGICGEDADSTMLTDGMDAFANKLGDLEKRAALKKIMDTRQ